jgi:transposase
MAKRGTSRRYSPEFKRDAVALLRSSGRSIAQVAKELGVSDMSLSTWAPKKLSSPRPSAWRPSPLERGSRSSSKRSRS